jgi:hypothetical protein
MSAAEQRIYEELADQYERQKEPRQRDVFLVLAAAASFSAGRTDQAERLRSRLLHLSPHNLLRPFPSFAEALASRDIKDYVQDLRRQFPAEQAEKLIANRESRFIPPAKGDENGLPSLFNLQESVPLPKAPSPMRLNQGGPKIPYKAPSPSWKQATDTEFDGSWLASLLFLLVLAAALALAGWTVVKPLL